MFQEEPEGKNSSDESSSEYEDESSDDDHTWTKEMKKQHKIIQREHRAREMEQNAETSQPKMFELRRGEEFKGLHGLKRKIDRYIAAAVVSYQSHPLFMFIGQRWVNDLKERISP